MARAPLARTASALLGGLMAIASARAQAPPWSLSVEEAITSDSNVLRAPDGQSRVADLLSRTTLGSGIDLPFGVQRLTAGASLHADRYRDSSRLDNNGASGFAAFDWQSADLLSGSLRAAAARELAPLGVDGLPTSGSGKNEQKTHEVDARVRLGLPGYNNLELALRHDGLDYSAPEHRAFDLWQRSAGLSYHFRTGGPLPWAVGFRHSEGGYPYALQPADGPRIADDFRRNDVDLSARWLPSGRSTLDLRLSGTRETHTTVRARDADALTASASWLYQPTPQLDLHLDAVRDTGAGSAFLGIEGDAGTGRDSGASIAETLALAGAWRSGASIEWQAAARWMRRNLVDTAVLSPGSGPVDAGTDQTRVLSLGFVVTPTPQWRVGCGVERDVRTTASPVSYAYHATVGRCSLRWGTR
jgi:hypothetical protein